MAITTAVRAKHGIKQLVSTNGVESRSLTPRAIRKIVLEQSKRADVGHIGSCLSVAHILCALYGDVLKIPSPDHPDRDRFVLSKGHAGLALYAVLALKGWISNAELNTFCGGNSRFGVHPENVVNGIDFSSGSLGQGLTMAAGSAMAARIQGSSRNTYCLLSDAECNEGSVWEAAMLAGHHKLDNLTVIVDWNGQQALGRTCDVIDCATLPQRWKAFGWRTTEVNGHSMTELVSAFCRKPQAEDRSPHVVLARTRFGMGVSFMEAGVSLTQTHVPAHAINWHYLPMSDFEYQTAMDELDSEE
jgi:transketolase